MSLEEAQLGALRLVRLVASGSLNEQLKERIITDVFDRHGAEAVLDVTLAACRLACSSLIAAHGSAGADVVPFIDDMVSAIEMSEDEPDLWVVST